MTITKTHAQALKNAAFDMAFATQVYYAAPRCPSKELTALYKEMREKEKAFEKMIDDLTEE